MEMNEKRELLDYLKNAIQVECDVLEQKSIIDSFTEISLQKKPKIETTPMPEKPQSDYYHQEKSKAGGYAAVGGGVAGILLSVVAMFSIGNQGSSQGFIIFLLIVVACICGWFIKEGAKMLSECKMINETNALIRDRNERAQKEYNDACRYIEDSNRKMKDAYKTNYPLWEKSHNDTLAYMNEPLQKTKKVLEGLYKKDFVYSKYHNLPALTSIYEYIITGRCEELSGPHGAYNLYEDEVRKDMVISQLNTIIDNLEQIKQNQFLLYQKVSDIQTEMSVIKAEMGRIEGFTYQIAQFSALNAYYSALTARNTEITMAYHLLNG